MMKPVIGKAMGVIDDVGVDIVLGLALMAVVGSAAPLQAMDDVRRHSSAAEVEVAAPTVTVVQMPAGPGGDRTQRSELARPAKRSSSHAAAAAAKPSRPAGATVARVRGADDGAGDAGEELDELRAMESAVRITIIGPDGQPRTKVVRTSGTRDRMATPARRPHD